MTPALTLEELPSTVWQTSAVLLGVAFLLAATMAVCIAIGAFWGAELERARLAEQCRDVGAYSRAGYLLECRLMEAPTL